jgi:glycosyltransferase involved in cell wall biosynthesis
MNLLYTLTAYPPFIAGAQMHQHQLAKALVAQGHDIQVLCHWNQARRDWLLGTTLLHPPNADCVHEGIPVHRLGLSAAEKLRLAPIVPLYYPLMPWAIQQIAPIFATKIAPFAQTADLIHNVRIGREGLTYAARQVATQYDIPFVLTPVHHPRWQGWRYQVYNQLYRQADAVIALTESERNILITLGVKPDRIHVTGVGPILAPQANAERFRATFAISAPFVLFLGQHYLYKGFRQLLMAAPVVWQSFPDLHFVFIGPAVGQSERLFQAFPDPRIHRLGPVDLQTKTDALAACEILCLPSMQESFGGVYTEAWSFKKPVIGGRIPAIADVISEGEDGLLVEQTADEIAAAICSLCQHPGTAQRLGEAGYAKVQRSFAWAQLAKQTLQIYQQLC